MPKKNKFKQSYRSSWETLPELRVSNICDSAEEVVEAVAILLFLRNRLFGWLQSVPNEPTKAYCSICKKSLYAHRLSLLQHSCTVRHSKLARIKFLEDKGEKSVAAGLSESITIVELPGEMPATNAEQIEPLTNDVLTGVVDIVLNGFEGPVINEYEAPNLYINSLPQSLPDNCYSNSCTQFCVSQVDNKSPISTHVLDTSKGVPCQNLEVSLYQLVDGRWTLINECVTNPDGRCDDFITGESTPAGRYKLHFDVNKYFELRKQNCFYPFIEVVFDVWSPTEHHHIPLILSPFGYSTYKGS